MLTRAAQLSRLETLQLANNELRAEGARAIAAATQLSRLTWLGLRGNELGAEGARVLAGATHLARLQHLDLGHNLLGVDGARALADAAHFAGLRDLRVQANQLGPDGARALAGHDGRRLVGVLERYPAGLMDPFVSSSRLPSARAWRRTCAACARCPEASASPWQARSSTVSSRAGHCEPPRPSRAP